MRRHRVVEGGHRRILFDGICLSALFLAARGQVTSLKPVASTRIRALNGVLDTVWGGGSRTDPVGLRSTTFPAAAGEPFEWFLKFDLRALDRHYLTGAMLSVTKCKASRSCEQSCRLSGKCICPTSWGLAPASCGGGNIDDPVTNSDDLHLWHIPNAWDDSWTFRKWRETWSPASQQGVERCCDQGLGGSSKMDFAHYVTGMKDVGEMGSTMFDITQVLANSLPSGGLEIKGDVISFRITVNGTSSRFFVPAGGDPTYAPQLFLSGVSPPTTTTTTTTSTTSTTTSTTSTSTSTSTNTTSTTSTSTTSTTTSTNTTSTTSSTTSTTNATTSTNTTSTSTTSTTTTSTTSTNSTSTTTTSTTSTNTTSTTTTSTTSSTTSSTNTTQTTTTTSTNTTSTTTTSTTSSTTSSTNTTQTTTTSTSTTTTTSTNTTLTTTSSTTTVTTSSTNSSTSTNTPATTTSSTSTTTSTSASTTLTTTTSTTAVTTTSTSSNTSTNTRATAASSTTTARSAIFAKSTTSTTNKSTTPFQAIEAAQITTATRTTVITTTTLAASTSTRTTSPTTSRERMPLEIASTTELKLARNYSLLAIAATLEVGTDRRWDALESWVAEAVSVVQSTIVKQLGAPQEWEGQRVVLVTGGSIRSSGTTSTAEINFRALVPPSIHLDEPSRRLSAVLLDNSTYHERVHIWQNLLGSLDTSTKFKKNVETELLAVGLPIPPGMSIGSKALGTNAFDEVPTPSQPEFVLYKEPTVSAAPNAAGNQGPSTILAATLMPVVVVVLCLNGCLLSRVQCVRKHIDKWASALRNHSAQKGVLTLDGTPGSPSLSKGTVAQISTEDNTVQPLPAGWQGDACRAASVITLHVPAVANESDDIDICSFTSSPAGSASPISSPIACPRRQIADTPDVKTPFQKGTPIQDTLARQTFNVEDLSPAPAGMAGTKKEATSAAPAAQAGLNGIMAVQPPQPPRHKTRPQAAGPPLREALEALEQPPKVDESSRWSEWVSFSPLRRALNPRHFQPPPEALSQQSGAAQANNTMGLSPGQRAAAEEEFDMPNAVPSPARHRRPKPRTLDGDLFDEAEAGPRSLTRSDRSTPHRDTCIQISSPFADNKYPTPNRRPKPTALNFAVEHISSSLGW